MNATRFLEHSTLASLAPLRSPKHEETSHVQLRIALKSVLLTNLTTKVKIYTSIQITCCSLFDWTKARGIF
jgi:hypothetical protein